MKEREPFWWPFRGLPLRVRFEGRLYVRSLGLPHPKVAAHYREHVPRSSAHLYVFEDGSAVVDHVDETNPAFGLLAHLAEG